MLALWSAFFKHLVFSSTHYDNAYKVLTTALQCKKTKKPYTLAGLDPGSSVL
jgi:hypothetical protein